MNNIVYEIHTVKDPTLPITFHDTKESDNWSGFYHHWHEHLEILYINEGQAYMTINNKQVLVKKGDIVVFNCNEMHALFPRPENFSYYCIIINRVFLDSHFMSMENIVIDTIINDEEATKLYKSIAEEMNERKNYYKLAVKSYLNTLMVVLLRKHSHTDSSTVSKESNQKRKMVQDAINYITANYNRLITVDEISDSVGFSKYYFCHTFKEITGHTVVDFLNAFRCNQASRLLASKEYNVSDVASACGFNNLSYFTKTYKKYMNKLPSIENKAKDE